MNFPTLNTPRLKLIEINESHLDDLFEIFSDEETMKFYDIWPHQDKESTLLHNQSYQKRYTEGAGIRWGISLDDKLIGTIGFVWHPKRHIANFGYDLNKIYWGKGLMTEAIEVVLKYAFEVQKIHRVEAQTDPQNIASQRVLLKNGFLREGELRDKMFFRDRYNTVVSFSKLITDHSSK
jgi:ribosomal-protein-alanine N-acetyltransferase